MLKLNASYSKKVPAESDYSSQSYHCQIEVELPDGLNPQQLNEKVHNVFDFVRKSVEAELHNAAPAQQMAHQLMPSQAQQPVQPQPVQQQYYDPQVNYQQTQPQQYQSNQGKQYRNSNAVASPKQVNYLLSLAKRVGWTVQQILQRCNVPAVDQIPSKVCSQLIQEFSGNAA